MSSDFRDKFKWLWLISKGSRLQVAILTTLYGAVSLSGIGIAVISKQLVDEATKGADKSVLINLLIVYGLLVFGEVIATTIKSLFNAHVWQKQSIRLRKLLYDRIIKAYWLESISMHSGDYIARYNDDVVTVINGIVDDMYFLMGSGIKFIGAFGVLYFYSPLIAIFAFVFGPIAFVITRVFSKKLSVIYKAIQKRNSEITQKVQECLYNIQIIKVYQLENTTSDELEEVLKERKDLVIKNIWISNIMNIIRSLASWGGYFAAYAVGIFGILEGTISFGVLVVFLQLFNQIQGPMASIAGTLPKMVKTFAAAERLMEIESMTDENSLFSGMNPQLLPKSISIEVKDLSFGYVNKKEQLNSAYMRISSGDIALLLGKSGIGKTTLIRLMLSLMKPDEGHIYFINENNEQYEVNPLLRHWSSYVSQETSLMSGTIRSNVLSGNTNADFNQLKVALEHAQAWSFVSKLEQNIDYEIGERGNGISGGQAQRIAIARALISKAPFCILDEATSGLDVETEQLIMENIKRYYSHKTFLVITHREHIRQYASHVYHLSEGKISKEDV